MTHNLVSVDISSNIQLTYSKDDHSASSWPDHVLTLKHQLQDVACLDSVENFLDHLPIVFQFPLSLMSTSFDVSLHSVYTANRVDWNKLSSQQAQDFCDFLHECLPSIPDHLVDCCDPICNLHC